MEERHTGTVQPKAVSLCFNVAVGHQLRYDVWISGHIAEDDSSFGLLESQSKPAGGVSVQVAEGYVCTLFDKGKVHVRQDCVRKGHGVCDEGAIMLRAVTEAGLKDLAEAVGSRRITHVICTIN